MIAFSATSVLDLVEDKIAETAQAANTMALAAPGAFDAIGAGKGVAVRLNTLTEIKNDLVKAGLRAHEQRRAAVAPSAIAEIRATNALVSSEIDNASDETTRERLQALSAALSAAETLAQTLIAQAVAA